MADVTRLPFADGVFDGGVCAHVIYHIPGREKQQAAFREMYRALARGRTSVILYVNPNHLYLDLGQGFVPLSTSLLRLAKRRFTRLVGRKQADEDDSAYYAPVKETGESLYLRAYPVGWVKSLFPPREVEVRCLRYFSHGFTRRWVRDNSAFWSAFLRLASRIEDLLPHVLAHVGNYVVVIVRKREHERINRGTPHAGR